MWSDEFYCSRRDNRREKREQMIVMEFKKVRAEEMPDGGCALSGLRMSAGCRSGKRSAIGQKRRMAAAPYPAYG